MLKVRKQNLIRVMSLVTLYMCVPAYGGDNDYLNMDIEQLLQVPVSGSTLRDESLKTVPAAVTVFTYADIERMGVNYLYELLSFAPGYQNVRTGNCGDCYAFSARGRRISEQAREILLLVDGRVFNNPRSGSAETALPLYPLVNIERVEIMRGPGSAIYGSNAFMGVINIITRQNASELNVSAGNLNQRSAQMLWSSTLADTWRINLFAHANQDDGQNYSVKDTFSGSPIRINDASRAWNFDVSIANENTKLTLALNKDIDVGFYQFENTQNNFNESTKSLNTFSIEQKFSLIDAMKSKLSLDITQVSYTTNFAIMGAGQVAGISKPVSNDPFLLIPHFEGKSIRLLQSNDKSISDQSSIQFGFQYAHDSIDQGDALNNYDLADFSQKHFPIRSYGDFSQDTPVNLAASRRYLGGYGQYLHEFYKGGRLTLGGRYDNYSKIGTHFSPRLGWVQPLFMNQTLKLLYGEAYRAPSMAEMELINNPVLQGNPNLSYEVVKTWDLIWMRHWSTTNITLDLFHNRFNQPIVTGLIGNTRTYINGADEQSAGTEMELVQNINDHWQLRATYTHLFDLPESAFREADQLASVAINYHMGFWNVNLAGTYEGDKSGLTKAGAYSQLDGRLLWNAKIRYNFSENYTLALQAKNATNHFYVSPAQGNNLAQGVPYRGRELSLQLGINF